ncbi:Pleckstrin homology domain-containing protein [Fusarium flagelliforme]|uniref:Immunogenic protein n=1 Tax=Fusarium flagelliforme TaxID=2675880 RepID=A0A395M752_9HYPO|nr:Pleckstrin homology domain-containing protein [Fusarium flagelliforme]KAH7197183.1 Pleckstrin homology domain-containing protein [Fusarium flagelliforme]RFN43143.1 immunogenic protein [Fusarium flagelliforme]
MAEEQKNIELPQETKPETTGISAPAVEAPAETKPVEETPVVAAETAPATEEKPVEETKPAEEAAKTEEEKKEDEAKPIEEGHLNHKAQGLSFPKNLIPTKEFFFFGTEAVEPKTLSHYLKSEKSAETAHSNIAWASETGKGLLFVGDKKNPSGVISLADATEPEIDGSNKFHLTAKGNKHTFKASNTAERDNWVAQLKLKIAEAKELASTVTESETYKATLESFNPAKKEEKAAETPKEETAVAVPATEEAAPVAEEAAKEEEIKDVKPEEPKRRSASRKRTSFFGFGKKEEAKKEEVKKEAETKNADEVAVETPAAETPAVEEVPKVEEPAKPVEEVPVVAPVVVEEPAKVAEETPAEAVPATTEEKPLESPKEKPTAIKRNSFFGNVFSKKEKKTPELKPTEPEAPKDVAEAETTAPVIPPVEATTPLAVDVSNPATVPTETTEAAAATSPAPEAKKDLKEKRKSSLPFAFGKRDKSPAPVEGEKKESPFSKLRNTIRGKSPKPAEKREENKEETVQEEPTEVKAEEPKTDEAPKIEEPTEAEKPKDAAPAPVVTAAA